MYSGQYGSSNISMKQGCNGVRFVVSRRQKCCCGYNESSEQKKQSGGKREVTVNPCVPTHSYGCRARVKVVHAASGMEAEPRDKDLNQTRGNILVFTESRNDKAEQVTDRPKKK